MPRFQLYDLETDISERVNIIEEHPAIEAYMKKILVGYIRNGRSTPGPRQENNGEEIWEAIRWLENEH